jgi:hypothetical protein
MSEGEMKIEPLLKPVALGSLMEWAVLAEAT